MPNEPKSLDLGKETFQRKPQNPPVLRPRPSKPKGQRPASNVPGLTGSLPLQPGELILTDSEKKTLQKFNWKEGDPLPGDIADRIKKARASIAEDIRTAKPPQDHPVLKPPEPVDISTLDPARQAELQQYLGEFKELAPQIEAAAQAGTEFSQLSPEIQKAIQDSGEGIKVVDSSQQDPIKNLQEQIDIAEGRKPEQRNDTGLEEEEKEEGSEESPTGATAPISRCPRCDFEIRATPRPPAKEDKMTYVAAILGSKPFRKIYNLYGGKVQLVFRQLSTDRAQLAFDQVAHEIRMGERGEDAYKQVMTYRMLLSLEGTVINGQEIDVADSVDKFLAEPVGDKDEIKKTDVLPIMLNRIQAVEPLNSESLWRACYQSYTAFNDLLEDLDTRADHPDFWNAIED